MRRLLQIIVIVLVLSVPLAVSVYALEHDHSWQENGDTYVGVFHVKDLPATDLERWKSIVTSPRLFAEEDVNRNIYFLEVPEGVKGKIVKNPPGSSFAYDVRFSPGFDMKGMVFAYSQSTGMYEFKTRYDLNGFLGFGLDAVIVNRGFDLTSSVPVSELYIQHPGNLYLVDDLGNEMPGDGDADDGDPWWKHLLDWLDSFWKKLKDFFVPEDGFFSDWFNEIKEAAMKKLKPVSEGYEYLKGAFDSLKSDSSDTGLYLDLPANQFFDGFPGIRVSMLRGVGSMLGAIKTILTMICVVFTVIICYKRIIVIFEQ